VVFSNPCFSSRVDILEHDGGFRRTVAMTDQKKDRWSDNVSTTQQLLQEAETSDNTWPLEIVNNYEVKNEETDDHLVFVATGIFTSILAVFYS
jgi:hypothetical protein